MKYQNLAKINMRHEVTAIIMSLILLKKIQVKF